MQSIERRCRECGTGKIRPVARAGRKARYKTMELAIPANIAIPTCDNCGSEWTDRATTKALDDALAKIYQEELRKRAMKLIIDIGLHTSMRQVERAIGISEGYLSKIRNGRSEPSAELVASLYLVSKNTVSSLRGLDRLWTETEKNALHEKKYGKRAAR